MIINKLRVTIEIKKIMYKRFKLVGWGLERGAEYVGKKKNENKLILTK